MVSTLGALGGLLSGLLFGGVARAQDEDVDGTEAAAEVAAAAAPAGGVAPCDPAGFPRQDGHEVGVLADGGVCIDGARVTGRLDEVAAAKVAASKRPWRLTADPQGSDRQVAWVLRTLKEAGVSDLSVDYAPVAPPPVGVAAVDGLVSTDVVARVGELSVRPVADLRVGLGVDRLDALGSGDGVPSGLRFGSQFLIAGAHGDLGRYVSAQVTLRAVERGGIDEIPFTTDAGDTGTVGVPQSTDGHAVRPRDAWVSFRPTGSADLDFRLGVQASVFGSRDWFNHPVSGIYLVGPDQFSMVQVVGLAPPRSEGLAMRANFGRVGVDAMLSNGTPASVPEDNAGKELDLRLRAELGGGLHLSASGKRGTVGSTDEGSLTAWSVEARLVLESLDLQAEAFGGVEDVNTAQPGSRSFIGGQGAGQVRFDLPMAWLDHGALTARLGYYDPQSDTVDADAFLLANGGLRAIWPTEGRSTVFSGLGYQILVPMDITAEVAHSALLQAGWFY